MRAIATLGASLRQLELPAGIGDYHPRDGVEPAGLMPDLHVLPGIWTAVKGYDRLLARLRSLGYRESGPGVPPGNLIPIETRRLRPSGETITIDGLAPDAHTIDVSGTDPASPSAPVSSDILVWEASCSPRESASGHPGPADY